MDGFPFAAAPEPARSDILRVAEAERERQRRRLIMIPSESICHPAAAEIVAGDLGNIYAEGLPQPVLNHDPRESALDEARFASWQTRLSDRRFYKGTVNANRAELIAHLRIAEVFAGLEGSPDAGDIHVNVQPLSGAAANLAVFEALLRPGDTLMGLDLSHGGHLTHGSQFNVSGKTYCARSYEVDDETRRLDYGRIRERALEFTPKLIIGGASAYPWDLDWAELRSIADEVGAWLLADVAHLAGPIAAGVLSNPLPHAHVVTFTTHKTLCGPRGAAILTADPELGRKMDLAVFPGMQGGPHVNSIAAIARLFELILEDADGFRRFQRATLDNTRFLARRLEEEGFALEYRGTNTHMLLVDLKPFTADGCAGPDGEAASRLLEISGIVCNKNVIPGDVDAAHATGLRFGMTWLTQRGVTRGHIEEIARIVKFVLSSARTFSVLAPGGEERCRGRVRPGILDEASERTLAIADALPYPPRPVARSQPEAPPRLGDRVALLARGDKVRLALSQTLAARLPHDRGPVRTPMLREDGSPVADVIAVELERRGREERWALLVHAGRADATRRWFEALSDGYLLFDEDDPQKKMDGPIVVEAYDVSELSADLLREIRACEGEPVSDVTKPFFIGQRPLYAAARPAAKEKYEYAEEDRPLRRTALHGVHESLGAKMAPFAGWEMPIQYPSGILAEHRAVRTAAGLFDVSHMGSIEVSGPDALAFLDSLLSNCVSRLDPGEAQYSSVLRPDGTAIDDVFVYRLEWERFMVVVNAANAERVKDWMEAVNSGRVCVDDDAPAKRLDGPVRLRDLRDAGEDSRVGLAVQGPASLETLRKLAGSRAHGDTLARLSPNAFARASMAGLGCLVARTGYTGEKLGFEVYVHPDRAPKLWDAILDAGGPMGVMPAGLGARDSTRIEAGLPLFGHELEGELRISMTEAGYGFAVRLHAPFFVGREAYMERAHRSRRHILRLRGQGRKTVRPGHVILDESGAAAGEVTSFAYVHEDLTFVALACVEPGFRPAAGVSVRGARVARARYSGEADERRAVALTLLPRFPDEAEREAWRERYAQRPTLSAERG